MDLPVNAPSQDDKNVQASSIRSPAQHISSWRSAWLLPLKPSLRSPPTAPKSDRNVVASSTRSPPEQISRWGSAWLLPLKPSLRSPPASPKSDRNVVASSTRSPPEQISRWGSAWLLPLKPSLRSPPASPKSGVASSMRSPPEQISRWGWGWLFPLRLPWKPTRPDQLSGWAWLFPSGHISHAASSIRSFTQVCKKCSSIVNAKPTGADQPLRFSMALPLKSSPTSSSRSFTQTKHNFQAS